MTSQLQHQHPKLLGQAASINLKPVLVSVVTAHMVYFCAFAHSEIFQKNPRELGVGHGQFPSGVNGLRNLKFIKCKM